MIRPTLLLMCCCTAVICLPLAAQNSDANLEENWKDFLHYTAIGRLDLAEGYARTILQSDPDPVELLRLSEENPRGYGILLKVHENHEGLQEVTGKLLEIIENGRYMRRTDPQIITAEIRRLSSTLRGRLTAIVRLRNAGEYAVPYLVDALGDEQRKQEFANVASALPELGRGTIRPMVAALQSDEITVKIEIIKALGQMGYPQSLGYLKYVAENSDSQSVRQAAMEAVGQIDASAKNLSAAELFFRLAESYYYQADSLAPAQDYDYANIWFWDEQLGSLRREEVDKEYFSELMTMRCCEWALKADPATGKAISLWIAAFFRAEGDGMDKPDYFGSGHADALTYAVTAGPEYLHEALARAIKDKDAVVALAVIDALAANAGEKSLMYRYKTSQPLIDALQFDNRPVRYSAAIAIGLAGPTEDFAEKGIVIDNLIEAVNIEKAEQWTGRLADSYATRSMSAMLELAVSRNEVIDLSLALEGLVEATKDERENIKILAASVLAYLESPQAQRAIAEQGLNETNSLKVRIAAFNSLATSAKLNSYQLTDGQIDAVYSVVSSRDIDPQLRTSAAAAYGSLNLPSRKVKQLILDQARS